MKGKITSARHLVFAAVLCGLIVLTGGPIALSAIETDRIPERISTKGLRELRSLTDTLRPAITGIGARSATSTSPAQQLKIAQKRGRIMEELAQSDPQAFLRNVISPEARAKLPSAIQAEVEIQTTVTGTLDVLHTDDFSNERNSRFAYQVNTGTERFSLYLAGGAPALTSGAVVEIKGYQKGKKIIAEARAGEFRVLKKPKLETVGMQNTLIILITQPGLPNTPTKDKMKKMIFTGNFEKYYDEQSYKNIRFVGDVTDWISIPTSSYLGCVSPTLDQSEVKNHITQNRIDLSRYGRLVFVINGWQGGCAFVGKSDVTFNGGAYRLSQGWVGWPDDGWQKSNMSGFEYVLAHEMGHELGVMHANSWSCTGLSLDTGCYHSEYGNSFDVMGNGDSAAHFNAFYKDILGWLATSSKVFIRQTGSYTLLPLEAQSGVRAAVITNPSVPSIAPLYLEFRQPTGFDSVLSPLSAGIHINQVVPDYLPFPRLINANYAIDPNSQQALMQGSSFAWDSHGISIGSFSIKKRSTASFAVAVKPVVCELIGFEAADMAGRTQLGSGSYGYVSFTLNNKDRASCPPSDVSVSATISGGEDWFIDAYPSSIASAPGAGAYMQISFKVPESTVGSRTLTIVVTDTTNNRTLILERFLTITTPPTISAISPMRGAAGSVVEITGSGFDTSKSANSLSVYDTSSTVGAFVTGVSGASSGSLSFTFPTTMDDSVGKGTSATQIPTPPGTYYITLIRDSDGAQSNVVSFDVLITPKLSRAQFSLLPFEDYYSQIANALASLDLVLKKISTSMFQ